MTGIAQSSTFPSDNQNNSVNLFTCLTTVKQDQIRESTEKDGTR